MWQDLKDYAFSQGWIDAGGIRTRYLRSGADNGKTLIFLHGTGGHAEAYVRNLGPHGQHFDCWAIDMVGHGWTDKPDHDLEIRHYVDHVLRFMDAVGVESALLSGESLGGWVASRLAADYPERVERLVLNTAGGSQALPDVMAAIKSVSLRAAEDPSWALIKARLEWLVVDKSKVTDDLVAARQAIYMQAGMNVAIRHGLALQEMDVRQRNLMREEDYARIQCPTLVLWTSDDPTASIEQGQWIASAITGASFVIMDRCGHWPQYEEPETFNRLHIDFLRG
ncbi:2-hydroxy-6-ketonona-2,4-dienedioic acid hydrolase [Sphingobium sp. BS19]|nr:2-hydroxy-6-ketonona-2,4-dienedioic acid hydrolase [Sphingobium sp. BS19]